MSEKLALVVDSGQIRQINIGDRVSGSQFPAWDSTYTWDDFQPAYVNMVSRLEPYAGGEFETFNSGITANNSFSGAVAAPNGCLYFIPNNYTKVVKLDPSDDSLTEIGPTMNGTLKWNSGALAPNGTIYAMPATNNTVLKINTLNDYVEEINATSVNAIKYVGAAIVGGKLYGAPLNTNTIGIFDLTTENFTTVNIGTANGAVPSLVVGPDDNLYLIPRDGTVIGLFNTTNNAYSTFGTVSANTLKWQKGVITPGGRIYCSPITENTTLVIDPIRQAFSLATSPSGSVKSTHMVMGPDGNVYVIPRDYTKIFRYRFDSFSYQEYGTINGTSKYTGGRLAENGYIYCAPFNTTDVLKIKVANEVPRDFCLSRYINYF